MSTQFEEIKARLQAAMPKAEGMQDRLAKEYTPETKTDYGSKLAAVWYDDGDLCAEVRGNLGLDIDGDAMAELFAHAMRDVKTLLENVETLQKALEEIANHPTCSDYGEDDYDNGLSRGHRQAAEIAKKALELERSL